MQILQPHSAFGIGFDVVRIYLVLDQALTLVCVGIGDPDFGIEHGFNLPEIRQQVGDDIITANILLKGFPGFLPISCVFKPGINDNSRLSAGDLVIHLFEGFRQRLCFCGKHIGKLAVQKIDRNGLARQRHLLRIVAHQIQNTGEIRLELQQLALCADTRFQNAGQQGISNHCMSGRIEHIVALQAASLRDHPELIGIDNCDISPAVQNIEKIILVPGLRQIPFKHAHGLLKQIFCEISA